MSPKKNPDLEGMANSLKEVMEAAITKEGKLIFSSPTTLEDKEILEYQGRMRAMALHKFNNPGYVCAVNCYRSEKDMQAHKASGAIVLYIREMDLEVVMKGLGYSVDEEEHDMVAEKWGEFGSTIAEDFRKALTAKGFPELVMSKPISVRNAIMKGVEFSFDQYNLYQLNFSIKDMVAIVAELTMTKL